MPNELSETNRLARHLIVQAQMEMCYEACKVALRCLVDGNEDDGEAGEALRHAIEFVESTRQ